MIDWTDVDISELVQRIDDLETELGIVVEETANYHRWRFDENDGVWKCQHCPAVRVCKELPANVDKCK